MKYSLRSFDEQIGHGEDKEEIETLSVINEIKVNAFNQPTKEAIAILIKNHQIALLQHKRHENIRLKCDQVLYFLETHFWDYLDHSLPVSDLGFRDVRTKTNFVVVELRVLISEMDEDFQKTLKPLCFPLISSTLHYIHYLDTFCNRWNNEFIYSEKDVDRHQELLILFLITYNYNLPGFFEYLTHQIKVKLKNADDLNNQANILQLYLDQLSCISSCASISFSSDFEPIKDILKQWLKNELKVCMKRIKSFSSDQLGLFPSKQCKVETSLSVAQIAYLMKLMYTSGVTVNKVQQDVLQAISKTFCSKKMEYMSFGSLQSKYYHVEDATKQAVKDILLAMIKNIK
ncbi:MAG: hypothetical protein H7282_01600 [Cytophagaceae bacterium]|nr:hypothetical protein [Cytophagaceae bacterium]